MLKTKYIFILLFCIFMLVLSLGFYVVIKQNFEISITNQYEQKLKSIDDVLRFSLIDELNASNIDDFARQTRIDIIILKDNFIISSIDENSSLVRDDEMMDEALQDETAQDEVQSEVVQNEVQADEAQGGVQGDEVQTHGVQGGEEARSDETQGGEVAQSAKIQSSQAQALDAPNKEAQSSEAQTLGTLDNETQASQTQNSKAQKLINFFIQNSSQKLKKARIEDNDVFYKSYEFQNYRYIIITYPKYTQLEDYESKALLMLILCGLIFFVLLQIFSKKLRMSFEKILIFLEKIDKKEQILLAPSIFKELNELNQKLYKTKEFLLKKDRQSKKQEAKISLKNTQLSSVISAISHELKNPLSVIDLSLDLLKDEKMSDKKLKASLLEKISQQSTKLNALTDKLNFVFNLSYQALNKKEFDLFALCAKIVQTPGFERVRLTGSGEKVFADELLIEQVIINLLSNALKYSQDEVILSVSGTLVAVKDSGKGIAPNQITLITKKFYKIDSTSENSFGIGLFLVKKILNMHEASLIIHSELNKGSEFSFTLERKDDTQD